MTMTLPGSSVTRRQRRAFIVVLWLSAKMDRRSPQWFALAARLGHAIYSTLITSISCAGRGSVVII
jgi:hypothetical protein